MYDITYSLNILPNISGWLAIGVHIRGGPDYNSAEAVNDDLLQTIIAKLGKPFPLLFTSN